MSGTKVKNLLQTKMDKKIHVVEVGYSLIPKGKKLFAVNIFTGELKELLFERSRCILLTKGELPVKAFNRSKAIPKANAILTKMQSQLPSHLTVRNYAH